ncbi:MAG: M23 family metallopeptidase [Polyangiales bacterium]
MRRAAWWLLAAPTLLCGTPGHAEPHALDAQLDAARSALRGHEEQKAALIAEETRLPGTRRALEQALARDVRALYRLQRGGLLPLSGGLDAWIDHAARVAHLERMAARTLAQLADTQGAEQRLARDLADNAARLLAQTQALATLEAARTRRAEQEVAALRIAAAAPPPGAGADGRLSYGLTLGAGPAAGAGFASEKGALAAPVPLAGPDALRTGAGVSFAAQPGTSVRAAAAGRVTFAERHPEHGLSVIVDHGDGYRTLYGALAALDVQPGDALSKSTRLGSAGQAPVYFELRRGKDSLDARAWLER